MLLGSDPPFVSSRESGKTDERRRSSRQAVELTDEDAAGEADEGDARRSRSSTPRPFALQSAHQQDRKPKEVVSSQPSPSHSEQLHDSQHQIEIRKHSLSISDLLGGSSSSNAISTQARLALVEAAPTPAQGDPRVRKEQSKMDYEMSDCAQHDAMQRGFSSASATHDYGLQQPRLEMPHESQFRPGSLDQASLVALSDASRAASFEHDHGFNEQRYYNYQDAVIDDPNSRSSSSFSIHPSLSGGEDSSDGISHSHFRNSESSYFAASDSTGALEPFTLGRTRSDTVRRFNSYVSSASAPSGIGNAYDQNQIYHGRHFSGSQFSSESVLAGGATVALHSSQNDRQRTSSVASEASSSVSSTNDLRNSSGVEGPARKKRNKCSPEQSRQLEAFFSKNRNPTGKVREELAKRIRMPERSVQVWFQNKRAKTKMLEIKEGIPPELRTTVSKPKAMQRTMSTSAIDESAVSVRKDSQNSTSNVSRRKKTITQASHDAAGEPVIQLPVSSLCIGQWRRIKPLICLFSRRNQAFTWYLSSESVGFKLNCPRAYVKRIVFSGPRNPTMHEFGEGVQSQVGQLLVELDRPPQFFMEVFRSSGTKENDLEPQKASWRQCSDFTEGKQATTIFSHFICGPYDEMREMTLQLYETGGPVSEIVEFDDMPQSSPISASGQHGMMMPGHQQLMSTDRQTYALGQHADAHHGSTGSLGSAADAGSYYSQMGTWPIATSSWDQSGSHARQASHPIFTNVPVPSPHSASALDMNALRINTGDMSSLDPGFGAAAAEARTPQYDVNQAPAMQLNTIQWPHTAASGSTSWPTVGEVDGDVDRFAFTPAHTNVASAPAFQSHSFHAQQQDVNSMVGGAAPPRGQQMYDAHSLLFSAPDDVASASVSAATASPNKSQEQVSMQTNPIMFQQVSGSSGGDTSGAGDRSNI